jgi:hypothetical protein
MKLSHLLYAAAAIGIVHAQTTNITELLLDTPKCAVSRVIHLISPHFIWRARLTALGQLGCVTDGLTTYNCTLANLGSCLCTSIPFQSDISACVQKSCIFEDQARKFSPLQAMLVGDDASGSLADQSRCEYGREQPMRLGAQGVKKCRA